MEIIIASNQISASQLAAKHIARSIFRKPDSVLGLATGSTPILLYKELIRMHREEKLSFSEISTFNLDEYLGLQPSHPASYHRFMWENFFNHININPAKVHIPNGLLQGENAIEFCIDYEEKIRLAGGIDTQILGIGSDGHIGFNELGSSLVSRTRIKTLTQRTRTDNSRFFCTEAEVPHHVVTMGIGTIMEARQILLLAFGESKALAVAGAVEGPITASNPASILQMHPDARLYLDEQASSLLVRSDYYKSAFRQKPVWQKI